MCYATTRRAQKARAGSIAWLLTSHSSVFEHVIASPRTRTYARSTYYHRSSLPTTFDHSDVDKGLARNVLLIASETKDLSCTVERKALLCKAVLSLCDFGETGYRKTLRNRPRARSLSAFHSLSMVFRKSGVAIETRLLLSNGCR